MANPVYQLRVGNYKSFNNESDPAKKNLVILTLNSMEGVEKAKSMLISLGILNNQKINIRVLDANQVGPKAKEKK